MIPETEASLFTRIPLKWEVYGREAYFREGLEDAAELLPPEALWRIGLILIKPDGLVTGKTPVILRFLREHDFAIVAAEQLVLTRLHWREMWRYQLNCATMDRLMVNDLVLLGPALLLILHAQHDFSVPGSVWLSAHKGPSDTASQPPQCLRRLLGQSSRVLSFFHVADEPADVVRELAVLLDRPTRRCVLAAWANGQLAKKDIDRVLEAGESELRTLDANEALTRAEKECLRVDQTGPTRQVRKDLERMRRGERIAWAPFATAMAAAGIELDRWDLAVLGAHFIAYDEPGKAKQIKGVDPRLWTKKPSLYPS